MSDVADRTRSADLRVIHAMARELALADDSYRAIVGRVSAGATTSSADLDPGGRRRLMDELRRLGAGRKAARRRPRFAPGAQVAKIRALWIELHRAGAVDDPSEAALAAFVKRQIGQEIGRLGVDDAGRVIEALKGWVARAKAGRARP